MQFYDTAKAAKKPLGLLKPTKHLKLSSMNTKIDVDDLKILEQWDWKIFFSIDYCIEYDSLKRPYKLNFVISAKNQFWNYVAVVGCCNNTVPPVHN